VAFNHADNSNGVDGEIETETLYQGSLAFAGISHSLAPADYESPVYATDNWTLTTSDANAVLVGTLKDIDEKGRPVVYLG
jgi:hypothetical protein